MTKAKSSATSKRRSVSTRFVAALAVTATAGSALVGSFVAPQPAYAAQEQPSAGIEVGQVYAKMGTGITNDSATSTSPAYNNFIR